MKYFMLTVMSIFLLTGCEQNNGKSEKTQGMADKSFWIRSHAEPTKKYETWKGWEVNSIASIAQYGRGLGGMFDPYLGLPTGKPITAAWRVKRYQGEKPTHQCIEPNIDDYVTDFTNDEERKKFSKVNKKYHVCMDEYYARQKASERYEYYYARSGPSFRLIVPPRTARHAQYEFNMFYGQVANVPVQAMRPEHLEIRDSLYSQRCNQYNEDRCYHLPGKESDLNITLRSINYLPATEAGKLSSRWEVPDDVQDKLRDWQTITGITINRAQYDYLARRCDSRAYPVQVCFLDDNAPDLTEAQKAYIALRTWPGDAAANAIQPKPIVPTTNRWK